MPSDTTRTRKPNTKRPPVKRARKRNKKNPSRLRLIIALLAIVVLAGLVGNLIRLGVGDNHVPAWISRQILPEDCESRQGEKLSEVRDIAIHYVGNPGTTAQQNRDFFAQPTVDVNAHFVVGLEGEVIQCIPLDEKSSATNERNIDTISIEVCHPDETGQFTEETYASLVKLTAWLCDHEHIGRDRVIRHYDVTGKLCPLYFVEHEDAWSQFKQDVKDYGS